MIDVSLTHSTIMVENDQKHMNIDRLRIKKVNKTHHLLIGEFDSHHALDDNYQLAGFLYKKAGNDYKRLPYKIGPKNFCEFIKTEKLVYPSIKPVSDFPNDDTTCPWPAKTYHVYGFYPDPSKVPAILDNGDYMVEILLKKDEEILQGFKIFGSVLIKTFG